MFQIFLFSNKTFDGILPNEKVVLLVRKHKLFFYLPIFLFIFLVLLPFILLNFIDNFIYQHFSELIWFLIMAYISTLWLVLFFNLMIYSLTALILTNKRVIKIEEKGLFNYDRAELELDKIQDIQVNIRGLWGNFLNFGQISIQSAGTETKFDFNLLPHPLKIKDAILNTKNNKTPNPIKQT